MREKERDQVRKAYGEVFGGEACSFLAIDPGQLELGHCAVCQTIVQFMREDGRFHSAHRDSIETLLRHLHQEVGRYEDHKFYVLPRKGAEKPFHISNLFILAKSEIAV